LNLHYIRKLSCLYDSFWLLDSRQQIILNDPTPVCTISGNFHVNLNFSGSVVLGGGNRVLQYFPYISAGNNSFPYCGLTWPQVTMLFTLGYSYVQHLVQYGTSVSMALAPRPPVGFEPVTKDTLLQIPIPLL
jgi:hypothetical protein